MQAVTLMSQSGDAAMFFSPKRTDTSFADILQASTVAPSDAPAERLMEEPMEECTEKNEKDDITLTPTLIPFVIITPKETLLVSDKKTDTHEKDATLTPTLIPFAIITPKETLPANAWTEIPPANLRVGGKPAVTKTADDLKNVTTVPGPLQEKPENAQRSSTISTITDLIITLKDMLILLRDSRKNNPIPSEQQVELTNLLVEIPKIIESLNAQNTPEQGKPNTPALSELTHDITSTTTEIKDMPVNLVLLLSNVERAVTIGPTTTTTEAGIGTSPIQNTPTILETINTLLTELRGVVSEVSKTQTFKAELKMGIELTNKPVAPIIPVTENTSDSKASKGDTNTITEILSQNLVEEPLRDISEIPKDQPKLQNLKASDDTLRPLTPITSQTDKFAPISTPHAQTASIEKQTAILSQFRTFLAVNKLRAETEVTLRLHPRELGDIKVQITRIENQMTHEPATISARFQVSSDMVKAVLESNFNMLKDSLQQQGNFTMGQMSVDVQSENAQEQGFQNMMGQNTDRQSVLLPEDNIIANPQTVSAPAHVGDLDRVA